VRFTVYTLPDVLLLVLASNTSRRRTGWGFAFDLVRLSVSEAERIHDCVFCRLDLPWIAIFDREHILTFGGGVGVPLRVVGGIALCN
jgi:hypothetical protein